MSKVILTVGIPASGKTTWARKYAHDVGNTVIVSRDDIRHAHNWKSGTNENFVTDIHRAQIEAALLNGFDVIVADTNINQRFRDKLVKFCHEHGADVEIKVFPIGLDEALMRNDGREHEVPADVVRKFYDQYANCGVNKDTRLPCPRYAPYVAGGKPGTVVTDIDGTLAHMKNRNPYDESRVGEDEYDEVVAAAVIGVISKLDAESIVVSGRSDKCREQTEDWLVNHGFPYNHLFMRKHGDTRPDYVVKNEIYDASIIPYNDILAVFDDRDQVVRHLRARGITVFQVAPGRF